MFEGQSNARFESVQGSSGSWICTSILVHVSSSEHANGCERQVAAEEYGGKVELLFQRHTGGCFAGRADELCLQFDLFRKGPLTEAAADDGCEHICLTTFEACGGGCGEHGLGQLTQHPLQSRQQHFQGRLG